MLSPTQSTPLSSHQQSVPTNQLAFCWSGTKIFATTSDGYVRILSYPGFEPVLRENFGDEAEFTLDGHTAACFTAELQPSGRHLATGGSDSIIALWDTKDWICQRTITGLVGPVKSISTSGCANDTGYFTNLTNYVQASRLMAPILLEVAMKVRSHSPFPH